MCQAEFDIPEASDLKTKKENTTLTKRSGPNFVKTAKTLRGR